MGSTAQRIVVAFIVASAFVSVALSIVACGGLSPRYSGAWALEQSGVPQLLLEPNGSQWTVTDGLGRRYTCVEKDGGLVCTSSAHFTLTPRDGKLIWKFPAFTRGFELTLVHMDKVPAPWASRH